MSKERRAHGRTGRAKFLGHEISVAQNDTKIVKRTTKRSMDKSDCIIER